MSTSPLPWPADLTARILGSDAGHVPVPLHRLASARMLWLNHRAARDDPQFHRLGGDVSRYAQHLLDACAFQIVPARASSAILTGHAPDAIGYADRYGGGRIGFNGGSGRAVTVNGYYVKGVGRTPLVSSLTSEAHASGGAYLEECVRETIFAEIAAKEFPFSAVPTLAIIDTGVVQVWDTHLEPQSERRTLLVRPTFVRPAHFQRAAGFHSGYEKEGSLDEHRVCRVFGAAVDALGTDGLSQMYDQLWDRWTRQLAYAFVHRLPHGSDNTSNLATDGRLADFGAMSAVPSWAATATALQPERFRQRFGVIVGCIRSMAYFFGRHFEQEFASEEATRRRLEKLYDLYRRTIATEVLRACGATASTAFDAVKADRGFSLWTRAVTLIGHYQREMLDLVEATPDPAIAWDLDQLWDAQPPTHLRAIRSVLNDLIPAAERDDARRRNITLARNRPLLFKREMRSSIYRSVDIDRTLDPAADARRIADLIEHATTASQRDLGWR